MSTDIEIIISTLLSNIYAVTSKDSDEACEFIIELAEILDDRKAVSETFLRSLLIELNSKVKGHEIFK